MGFDISGALSGIWNATIGGAIRAVQEILDPPEPPATAPTMAKDETILRHTADWEQSVQLTPPAEIIGDKGGSILSNNGVNIIGNNSGNILGNNSASFQVVDGQSMPGTTPRTP